MARLGDKVNQIELLFGTQADEIAGQALSQVNGAKLLAWLPTAWKIQLCTTLLTMDSTDDDDEQAILEVLRQARSPSEFFHLYEGIKHETLNGSIDGAEGDQLYALFDTFLKKPGPKLS